MLDLAIIIINYNSSNDIRALLTALSTSQLPEKTTITCVDNASSTEEKSKLGLADQTINLRIHYLDQNIGFGPACNLACKLTQAKQYLLLNPDISLQETTITNLIEGSKSSPNAGIWGGTTVDTNGNYDGASAWKEPSLLNTFGWAFGVRNFINRDYLWDNYRTLGPSKLLKVSINNFFFILKKSIYA